VRPAGAGLEKLLDSRPEQASAMRRLSGIHTNKELAATLVFFTYILKDLQQRSGGNPFDNTNPYGTIVAQAGRAGHFVQQYVKRDGHCAITPAEIGRGFA
jgi:hypothetical protein